MLLLVNSTDGTAFPSDTGSALSIHVPRLYGFPGSTACEFAILSLKVFSIHLVLKVASQNRTSASAVYRCFPAPDFVISGAKSTARQGWHHEILRNDWV